MAVTTNTLQFGAELTATIKAGNWKIEGKIGGDALIRLPFFFDVSMHGGVHVKYRGHNLFGVEFKGGLSGPVAARAARRGLRLAPVLRRVLERQLSSSAIPATIAGTVDRQPRPGARRRA